MQDKTLLIEKQTVESTDVEKISTSSDDKPLKRHHVGCSGDSYFDKTTGKYVIIPGPAPKRLSPE